MSNLNTPIATGRRANGQQQHNQAHLDLVQLDRILAFNRQRLRQRDWHSFPPEKQRRIRNLVDSAALCLRREMGR